ncbi:hypothetical protein N658DRAFT_492965 [Parathielavia hyrcaniae]|uniref:Uncharacterized protein n=1 Tax=Parathielavia hyrcaniae TaxID=113614 RepID=A0AAN6QCA4_9PEZI|nr:hypothetical protein N658DRAFT_492965 [Parathielavia hyrcaniae]
MATPVNPFQAGMGRGNRRRTLQEVEAATKGSNALRDFHRQSTQPVAGLAKVTQWLCNQDDPTQLRKLSTPQSSRRSAVIILDDDDEAPGQRSRSLLGRAGPAAKPARQAPYTSPSSRRFSSNGLKRDVSHLDDSEEVIYVRTSPAPSNLGRPPRSVAVVDLTKSDRPTRQRSSLGNQDQDVMIIDRPVAEARCEMRQLIHGRPRGAEGQPRKRQKRAQAEMAPAPGIRERPVQRNPDAMVERMATPKADTIEASTLLQSVESVTHFFTLATEIRDKIYRHLLVSAKPVQVQRLWEELGRRISPRNLPGGDISSVPRDPRILTVCRRTAEEGARILYSENTFIYILRDPEVVENAGNAGVRRSQRGRNRKEQERSSTKVINLERYGHLIRHLAIELQNNRTETSYEKLMSAALETLIPAGSPRLPSPPRPPCGPIHLHTLAITVSPLFMTSQRAARAAGLGNQDAVLHEGRFLSMVNFFSRGAPVLKALQRVNVDFLRINVIVNSDIKEGHATGTASPWLDLTEDEIDDDDDDGDDSDEPNASSEHRRKRWHLETTIDLRCLPRHLQELARESRLWANDELMQEKRRQLGAEAAEKLTSLRRHIEYACLDPETAVRGEFWEEHGAAESRRRAQRAKEERRFDADAYEVEDASGGGDDDVSIARGMKSLIISIDRVGDELRAYRP